MLRPARKVLGFQGRSPLARISRSDTRPSAHGVTAHIYAGPGNVMQDPKSFRLKANGHYMATSYVGISFGCCRKWCST